jgi:transglutaminase-like putative cysteine protease
MSYRVTHTTTYDYSEPVSLCHNVVHLTPRNGPQQVCRHSRLLLNPQPAVSDERIDYFGNHVTFFTIQEPHQHLTLTSISETEVTPRVWPHPTATPAWESVRDRLARSRGAEELDAIQFVFPSLYVSWSAELVAYALPSFAPGRPILDAVLDLTQRIHAEFLYDRTATTVATPLREVLEARRGVCQDFAHLQIGCLRSLGLAARYVSGYLLTDPPPGQQRLVGADASHAWLSVYCPGAGWVDVDPTNNQIPTDKHVLVAWGRDYDDVSPIKGVILGGGRHGVNVSVDVTVI